MSAEAGEVRTNRLADLRGPGKAKVLKRAQRKYKILGNQNLPRMKERRSQITSYHIPRGQDPCACVGGLTDCARAFSSQSQMDLHHS